MYTHRNLDRRHAFDWLRRVLKRSEIAFRDDGHALQTPVRKAPPGPADVALMVEVSDSTLPWDRGTKRGVYARSSIPIYWIVNLLERQIEVHTGPAPEGYQHCRIYTASESLAVFVDGQEIGQLVVADILPSP